MQAFVALVFALLPLLEVRATEEPGAWEETLFETTVNGRRRPSLQGIRYGRYGSKLVNQQIWMILEEEPTQCVRRCSICEPKYLNPEKIAN